MADLDLLGPWYTPLFLHREVLSRFSIVGKSAVRCSDLFVWQISAAENANYFEK